jgi:hypothetical protein
MKIMERFLAGDRRRAAQGTSGIIPEVAALPEG